MKKISTTVKTGDILNLNGKEVRVGQFRSGKIALHYKISETSGYTINLTTRALNKLLVSNVTQ